MEEHFSTVSLKSKLNIIPYKLVLRVPNPLNIERVEDCPFYEQFMLHDRVNDDKSTWISMRILRKEIDNYVRVNELYCDLEHSKPMMYMII